MFCSTIIATIARPTLTRSVQSVLDQEFTADDFEVIVVNDTGKPLPDAAWQHSKRVQVIHTNRLMQSGACNAGAAIAIGEYLHILDDDDWMLPGAFKHLWDLAQNAQDAVWLYGNTQVVNRQEKPVLQLHHGMDGNIFIQVMSGEWIPFLSSLIQTEAFFDVGGFNPVLPTAEDIDLCRRIALIGDMASTSAVVACHAIGVEGSSQPRHLDAVYSRWAREKILAEPYVFSRMRNSANSSYWYGRIVRVYATSMVWNLWHKRGFTAASRALFGLWAFVEAGRHIFSPPFWQAIAREYQSITFAKGFESA
ncbi:MAG: glycosyltransferase [Anaerolineales bacterium]|nr:glycosyltransferase [Anaerolineales bacterium]